MVYGRKDVTPAERLAAAEALKTAEDLKATELKKKFRGRHSGATKMMMCVNCKCGGLTWANARQSCARMVSSGLPPDEARERSPACGMRHHRYAGAGPAATAVAAAAMASEAVHGLAALMQ